MSDLTASFQYLSPAGARATHFYRLVDPGDTPVLMDADAWQEQVAAILAQSTSAGGSAC